ncbi:MAG: LacI family DNA-binding transcriptional regulator [Syntrophobacteraceae bacterium]
MDPSRKKDKATLKDIAREAGVSATAVSLALKDPESSRVSVETRKTILAIAKRLNYRPNHIARSLVTRKTHTLGLVITTLTNPFYAELAQDIIERAQEKNYGVFTCTVQGSSHDHIIEGLMDRGVDGLIVCSATRNDPIIGILHRRGVPFSLAMRKVEEDAGDPLVDYVVIDNRRGAHMATEHLIKLGHVRIALLGGPKNTSTAYERSSGFLAALATHHLSACPELMVDGDFSRSSGARCAWEFIKAKPRPTAIFTVNDHMAIGVLETLREAGLRVPGDMAVVGFDDIEMAGLPGVDLTTISQKKATMGRLAVDNLIEKIENKVFDLAMRVILDPKLVIRQTCGYRLRNGYLSKDGGSV